MDFIRNMRSGLIIGISGNVGKALIEGLLKDKHYKQVVLLTRRESRRFKNIHLTRFIVDFNNMEEHLPVFEGIDDVFCLLGTDYVEIENISDAEHFDFDYPLNIARAAKLAGVKNFILLNPTDNGSKIEKLEKRNKLQAEIEMLHFDNYIVFKTNGIKKSVEIKKKKGIFKKLIKPFQNLTSSNLFLKVKKIPANVIADKMIDIAVSNPEGKKVFLPQDY